MAKSDPNTYEITLDGTQLTIEDLWRASQTAIMPGLKLKISLANAARDRIQAAERYVKKLADSAETVYGINTGFGYFAHTRIAASETTLLQKNIIRSHACGVGEELPRDLVLMMWLILLNSACRGHRGIGLDKIEHIIAMLEAGMLSCVPARGSVGASGDLAPSAHAVLATLGEGECTLYTPQGLERLPAAKALARLGLEPITLGPKEGLCLINGTQLTAAIAVKLWQESHQLLRTANMATAMTIEALRASHHLTDEPLLLEQRHKGTLECGRMITGWMSDQTEISQSHAECDRVQDAYSLRCAPQVHGMVWEELAHARLQLEKEINSTTDNPIVFPIRELVIHGGNFHAIYPARICDRLAAALATLATISERRINTAMRPEKSGLPAFLVKDGGLNSGFMMVQTTAAALASECKSLSFPASVDSIPTNNDQEDHVSMGPIAGVKALQVLKQARYVIAIEVLVAAQGLDMLAPLKTSARLETVKAKIRKIVPYLEQDRHLSPDIEAVHQMVLSGELLL